MVAHYTAHKKGRAKDDYSPGGKAGLRPDRATIVYGQPIREAFDDITIVIGGIEGASGENSRRLQLWDSAGAEDPFMPGISRLAGMKTQIIKSRSDFLKVLVLQGIRGKPSSKSLPPQNPHVRFRNFKGEISAALATAKILQKYHQKR